MAEPILRLEEIRKSYNLGLPSETEVLHGIDLSLMRGEFVALIGPSGSGKSTFLRCLNHLETIHRGTITIEELRAKLADIEKLPDGPGAGTP